MAANDQNSSGGDRRVDVSETTAEVQPADPYTEPPNSTVDDWLGQQVDRDSDAADRAMAEAGGDAAKAEEIFDRDRDRRSQES